MASGFLPGSDERRSAAAKLRKALTRLFLETGRPLNHVARDLRVVPSVLESYLNLDVVPNPQAFLDLRRVLKVSPDDRSIDVLYIMVLAAQEPRKRTSNIRKRHVPMVGAPDPLKADSAEELVEKLRELHRFVLQPSLRELEDRTGGVLKRSTIHEILRPANKTLPRFDRYALFLEACGVRDLTFWAAAWRRLAPRSSSKRVQMIEEIWFEQMHLLSAHEERKEFMDAL